MSSQQLQEERNFEQNTLIWLNDNFNDTEKIDQIKLALRQVINYVRIYKHVDECVDYISSNENEQIYFLISDSLADLIVPLIYEVSQIKMIHIFCMNGSYHGQLSATFNKINGIFTDLTILCNTIRENSLIVKTTASSISNSSTLLSISLSSSSTNRSNQQEADFMYFRLLTEARIEVHHK